MFAIAIADPTIAAAVEVVFRDLREALDDATVPGLYYNFVEFSAPASELFAPRSAARLGEIKKALDDRGTMVARHSVRGGAS